MVHPDSPKNWLQIRFLYKDFDSVHEGTVNRLEVDRRVFSKASEMDDDIGYWNIEWAIKASKGEREDGNSIEFLALRTKPKSDDREKVKQQLSQFADSLKKADLIFDYCFDNRTWLQIEDLPNYLTSWHEWYCLVRLLNHLSKAIAEILTLENYSRTTYFFYEKIIHHLHNMMHMQDSFRPQTLPNRIGIYSRALLSSNPRLLTKSGVVSWESSTTDEE